MSMLRKDPVSSGWVIMAEDRVGQQFSHPIPETQEDNTFCPFCEGSEYTTPHEILAYRKPDTLPDTPGWSVRTVPNKLAALRIEGELNRQGDGLYDMMNGIGAHEIIIETPDHNGQMADYTPEKITEILTMCKERIIDLEKDKRFKYFQIFRNYGVSAGGHLTHPHTQIIALPITPRWVKEELGCALEHYQVKERCLFCDIIKQEMRDMKRVLISNDDFLCFTPFASKFPFETWIMPKRHQPWFKTITEDELISLGDVLKKTFHAIKKALSNPPFNLIVHSAPQFPDEIIEKSSIMYDYHWHIEIFPRIGQMAGFEWGTGFYINPVLPERAAEYLTGILKTGDNA